jgi:beta-mannosidase
MSQQRDLSCLPWKLVGCYPYEFDLDVSLELGQKMQGELDPIDVQLPCSVQGALLKEGLIPDWNHGLNFRSCEWVENRFWTFFTEVPKEWFEEGQQSCLHFEGLDYNGTISFQGREIYNFANSLVSHRVPVRFDPSKGKAELKVVFHTPPRWLGQFGYTSKFNELKPRFSYWWDWTSRLVQTGITGAVTLESFDTARLEQVISHATYHEETGLAKLALELEVEGSQRVEVVVKVSDWANTIEEKSIGLHECPQGKIEMDLNGLEPWWPHGLGDSKLYQLQVAILSAAGEVLHSITRKIGFRQIEWLPIEGASPEADPWILSVNGRKCFLTGVNWTPIRPNYADLKRADYLELLNLYKEHGIKLLRVWGGAYLETQDFYELCDEMGFLVWQEFPLSSSGLDNVPPQDEASMKGYLETAKSYIVRRHHHPCHILWCGGNELREFKSDQGTPITNRHPLIKGFEELVERWDPSKRFIPSTPCGPEFHAKEENMGKGLHWAVNGPWKAEGPIEADWTRYFEKDDAYIRTEIGAPGPSDAAMIEKYSGGLDTVPCTNGNDLWRRQSWWTEGQEYEREMGAEPMDLEAYVKWGQERQSKALLVAAKNCLERFPRCGGIIFWMGHDSFPCTANTSLIDFEGKPKPALFALAKLWKQYDDIINPSV